MSNRVIYVWLGVGMLLLAVIFGTLALSLTIQGIPLILLFAAMAYCGICALDSFSKALFKKFRKNERGSWLDILIEVIFFFVTFGTS